jgi:hypothetical protein
LESNPSLFSPQCGAVTTPTELQLAIYCHDKPQVNKKFVTKGADMQVVGDEIYKALFAISFL